MGLFQKSNFNLLPSLEHIGFAQVAVELWKAYSRTLYYDYTLDAQHFWNSVESKVTGIVAKLSLPISIQKKILSFSKGLHWEIAIWVAVDLIYIPEEYISMCISHIKWTNIGTIEKKITVGNLVKSDGLPITSRYELACMYCFVEDIYHLYEQIQDKNSYKDIVNFKKNGISSNNVLIVMWTNYLRDGFLDNVSFDILSQLSHTSKAALEYFFETNGNEFCNLGKLYRIIKGISNEMNLKAYHSDTINFMMESFDIDEVEHLLHWDAYLCLEIEMYTRDNSFLSNILWNMVHWPWKYCFTETGPCTCKGYCNVLNFSRILNCILEVLERGRLTRNSQKLFHRHFWENLSDPCRNAFMKTEEFEISLLCLFKIEDQISIEIILEFYPYFKRMNFFTKYWQIVCKDLIDDNNSDLFELFIREFILSEDDMISFKTNIIKEFKETLQEVDRRKILQLIDEFNISGKKQIKFKTATEE